MDGTPLGEAASPTAAPSSRVSAIPAWHTGADEADSVPVPWVGRIAAGGTMIMLPVLVFSFIVRRYLVSGLTGGAIKG